MQSFASTISYRNYSDSVVNLVGEIEEKFVKQPLKQVGCGVRFGASSPDGVTINQLMMS